MSLKSKGTATKTSRKSIGIGFLIFWFGEIDNDFIVDLDHDMPTFHPNVGCVPFVVLGRRLSNLAQCIGRPKKLNNDTRFAVKIKSINN